MLLLLRKLERIKQRLTAHLKMKANLMSQVSIKAKLRLRLSSVLSKWIKTIRLSPFQPDQPSFNIAHT
jgi:hypothetical protein